MQLGYDMVIPHGLCIPLAVGSGAVIMKTSATDNCMCFGAVGVGLMGVCGLNPYCQV